MFLVIKKKRVDKDFNPRRPKNQRNKKNKEMG